MPHGWSIHGYDQIQPVVTLENRELPGVLRIRGGHVRIAPFHLGLECRIQLKLCARCRKELRDATQVVELGQRRDF